MDIDNNGIVDGQEDFDNDGILNKDDEDYQKTPEQDGINKSENAGSGQGDNNNYNIMKTDKKSLVTGIALGMLAIITISGVSAYKGDPSVQGPNYTPERHEAMEEAFENNDFETWATLIEGKGRVTQVINADNFVTFAEAHELAENGDIDGAKEIRAELGLGLKDGSGKGMGKGMNKGNGKRAGNSSESRGNNGDCQYK